jgi:hypothetical protein
VETATRGDDAIEANRAWRRTFGEATFRAASAILGSDDGRGGTHSALTPALEALLSDEHALDAAERSLAEATLRDPDVARSPEAKAASGGVERKKSYYQRAKKAVGFKSPTPVSTSTSANGDAAGSKRKLTLEEMRAAIDAAEAEGHHPAGAANELNARPTSPGVATVSLSELLDGGGGGGGDAGLGTGASLGLDDSTLADDLDDDDEEVRAAAAAAAAVLASGGAVPSAAKKRSVFSAFKKK